MAMRISVTIECREYVGQIMTINRVDMASWGADMVSVNIDFKAGATGQGTGLFGLDGDALVRWVRGFMDVTGVESFPQIVGQRVVVLRTSEFDMVQGVMALDDETKFFLVREGE